MTDKFHGTIKACFVGFIVQAIVNTFLPLLFLTLNATYDIPLIKITFLVTINFGIQLGIDIISVTFVDRIGYRISMLIAHATAALGLIFLAILPDIMSDPYTGILIAVVFYAIGGGLLEVLVSPLMEACPTENKEKAMSLLHSFYCWGVVGVILISTAFFSIFGTANWKYLCFLLALVPIANLIVFTKVPMATLIKEGETGMALPELFKNKTFWIMFLLMICGGASEQSVIQWASTFAESALGISKSLGDLAGPMLFAILMGIARTIYGKKGEKLPLEKCILGCGILCIISYLIISLVPNPTIALLGFSICGFSVGIFWPGVFSLSAKALPRGGTAAFAILALAGDLGCSAGPTFVGTMADFFGNNLRLGILCAIAFPVVLVIGVWGRKSVK